MPAHGQQPTTIVVVVEDPATTGADGARLCERLRGTLEASDADVGIVDVGALTDPDLGTVDTLARVLLTARLMGRDVRLRHASPALRELLALTGLVGVCGAASAQEVEHISHATDTGKLPRRTVASRRRAR